MFKLSFFKTGNKIGFKEKTTGSLKICHKTHRNVVKKSMGEKNNVVQELCDHKLLVFEDEIIMNFGKKNIGELKIKEGNDEWKLF